MELQGALPVAGLECEGCASPAAWYLGVRAEVDPRERWRWTAACDRSACHLAVQDAAMEHLCALLGDVEADATAWVIRVEPLPV